MRRDAKLTEAVKALALEAGFARTGVAPAGAVGGFDRFRVWLAEGLHADMAYLARGAELRARPDRLVEGARSVLCLAAAYAPADDDPPAGPRVARYARGRDYHRLLKRRCQALIGRLRRLVPSFRGRAFVDSAPVMERSLAAAAGVGWIGRNGCLIVPSLGSYVLLCEVVSDLPLCPDAPLAPACGDCDACLGACPTGALRRDGLVDCRLCASYLTIERRGAIDERHRAGMGERLFGCDACQEACPHNRGVPAGEQAFRGPAAPAPLGEVLAWTQADWDAATRGRATRRATCEMFLRNACIAAGNGSDAGLVGPLRRLAERAPHLADVAGWAARRLGGGNGV